MFVVVDARLDSGLDAASVASVDAWHTSLRSMFSKFGVKGSIFASVGGATVFSVRPTKVKVLEVRALTEGGNHAQHLIPVRCRDLKDDNLLPKALKGAFTYARKKPGGHCSILYVCYGRTPAVSEQLKSALQSLESLGTCYLSFLIFDDEMRVVSLPFSVAD